MSLDDFLSHFHSLRKTRGSWTAACPAHGDRSRNTLSIKLGTDQRRLVICRAGCRINEILSGAQLKAADLFEPSSRTTRTQGARPRDPDSLAAALAEVRRTARRAQKFQDAVYPVSDAIREGLQTVAFLRTATTRLGDVALAWDLAELAAAVERDVVILEAEQDALLVERRRE